ncbi:MAG: Ig-like domain-containing protein [Deltaproteobacteria bacterium]|nr:Ig-like domain-containing protein [Acidimicrobiia bacterium]
MRRLIALAFVAGCASAGAPPGGPEDHDPPQIVAVTPDSGKTNVMPKEVEFRFDEVVSDRPAGATALDQLFLISPRTSGGSANVSWHRSRITVRPPRGFRPNTAYRVTMLPGIADLRGNVRKVGASVLFSTGPTFPAFSIPGRVFDWAAQRVANGVYIEAISRADTNVVYLAASDSTGQFDLGPLDTGTYTVRAIIDQNANRTLDRNEKWDTTTVTVTTARPMIELDAIERDSSAATFQNIVVDDSVTLHVTFDKPLDPKIPLQPALVRLQRPDSSELTITKVVWAAAFDQAKQAADSARRADSARARPAPTAPVPPVPTPAGPRAPPPPPKPKSPPPDRAIVVTVSPTTPILPGITYRIEARGLRNLVGNSAQIRRTFSVPKPAPKDTTHKPPPDSARRPPADSVRRPSAGRPPQ